MSANKGLTHCLVPEHVKLSDKDSSELMKRFSVTVRELPKIIISDPAILHLDVKEGDIIMVKRISKTAGESVYYRCVIKE